MWGWVPSFNSTLGIFMVPSSVTALQSPQVQTRTPQCHCLFDPHPHLLLILALPCFTSMDELSSDQFHDFCRAPNPPRHCSSVIQHIPSFSTCHSLGFILNIYRYVLNVVMGTVGTQVIMVWPLQSRCLLSSQGNVLMAVHLMYIYGNVGEASLIHLFRKHLHISYALGTVQHLIGRTMVCVQGGHRLVQGTMNKQTGKYTFKRPTGVRAVKKTKQMNEQTVLQYESSTETGL